jgi:hypothetical protein
VRIEIKTGNKEKQNLEVDWIRERSDHWMKINDLFQCGESKDK